MLRNPIRPKLRPLVGAALAAAILAVPFPASAQVETYAEACGLAKTPLQVITTCTLAIKSDRLSPRGKAQAYVNRAWAFAERGQDSLAARDSSLAIQSAPDLMEAWLNRGNALTRMGRYGEASSDFERASSLSPNDPEPLVALGAARVLAGDGAGAAQALDRAAAVSPNARRDGRIFFNRGRAFVLQGRPQEAIRDFDAALALNSSDAQAYAFRGDARLLAGDRNGAYADYGQAVQVKPDYADAWLRRGKLAWDAGQRQQAAPDLRRAYELGAQDGWLAQAIVELGG